MRSWLTNLAERPALAVLALTAGCLAVFAATIPMPRVDGQLVGSDGVRYFVYLPSLLIDGDLDFADEYAFFYGYRPETADRLIADRTKAGLPANRFGVGPAILWSPFFAAAHLLALLAQALGLGQAADGTGTFHQAATLAGSILYGGAGAWLCFRAARRFASPASALAATLLVVLAGNPIYYLTVEPSMSHPLSMFAGAAFIQVWLASRGRPRWRDRLRLGALAGLMALIRPQDGLFLILPVAGELLATGRAWLERLGAILTMAAAAALVFLPQLVTWKLLNGGWLSSGYGREFDVLFHWPWARLLPVLVSAQRGLFTWHPIFLVALIGLLWLARRDRRLALLAFAGFAVQWLVVASWHQWTQGDAFGGRMFIVCAPIFVLGLAALLDAARRYWPWRRLLAGGAVLVLLNFLLLIQYRVELLYQLRPITFADLLLGRFLLFP